MIKKRDEKRIPFRKLVICKCGDEMHPGFTQDVSQHGIGIQTMQRPSLFNQGPHRPGRRPGLDLSGRRGPLGP